MTRFWWVRHGPTHAKGMVGWTDLPADLSDTAAIARLSAALPPAAPVISSDLARAVATADALQGARPRLPHDPALREIHFGQWEMRTHAQVSADHPALVRAFWDDPGPHAPPGGESWNGLTARVGAAIDRLAAAHPGGDIVVVAHFGAILAAIGHATGLPARATFAHRIEPLSLTEIALAPGGGTLHRVNARL